MENNSANKSEVPTSALLMELRCETIHDYLERQIVYIIHLYFAIIFSEFYPAKDFFV